MPKCIRQKVSYFTLLELLLSVIILGIVTSTASMVLRAIIDNYNRSQSFGNITQSLGGCSMILKNDIRNLLPIEDKEEVYFEKRKFSFIVKAINSSGNTELKLIRYVYERPILYRGSVRYPEEKKEIDKKLTEFMQNVMHFKIVYNNTRIDYEENEDYDDTLIENNSDDDLEEDEKSTDVPKLIQILGTVEDGNYINPFDISITVPLYGSSSNEEKEIEKNNKS
jgi:type II secretory pathway component PulJ